MVIGHIKDVKSNVIIVKKNGIKCLVIKLLLHEWREIRNTKMINFILKIVLL